MLIYVKKYILFKESILSKFFLQITDFKIVY